MSELRYKENPKEDSYIFGLKDRVRGWGVLLDVGDRFRFWCIKFEMSLRYPYWYPDGYPHLELRVFIWRYQLRIGSLWLYSKYLNLYKWIRSLKTSVGPSGEGNGTPLQCSCLENPTDGGAWWAAVHGVTKSQTRLSSFTLPFHFYALEKEMATHSTVLAWRIPGTGEPGGLPSMGSHRVGHGRGDLAAAVGTSLVVQCLRLCTPKAEAQVWPLVGELDPTHHN